MIDLMDYQDMERGETRAGECPNCGKHKFYVTRKDHGLAYICFRASCETQGFAGGSAYTRGPIETKLPAHRGRGRRQFTEELESLCVGLPDWDYLRRRFQIAEEYLTPKYVRLETHGGRYAFAVRGPNEEFRGWVLRRPIWDGTIEPPYADDYGPGMPKTVNYIDEYASTSLAWYWPRAGEDGLCQSVVLVEDQPSAMRLASMGIPTVALLGTRVGQREAQEIRQNARHRGILVALDPDAEAEGWKIARRYGAAWPGCRVASLKADPKDYERDSDLFADLKVSV